MYSKGHLSDKSLDSHYIEKFADVLYEIGKEMTTKKDFQMATKWLDRAHDIINGPDLEELSREALELRIAIMQSLVSALLNLETKDGFAKADNLIEFLHSERGNTMVVLILRLELLEKAPAEVFDSDAYAAILNQMIACFSQKDLHMDLVGKSAPGDTDFRLILHHVGRLYAKSPTQGCKVLDGFIRALSKVDHDEWIERLATKRIWMVTSKSDSLESIEATNVILSRIQKPLRAEATVAAQTVSGTVPLSLGWNLTAPS